MFRLGPNADTAGTYYLDSVLLPPVFLVDQFGPPGRASGDGKVSGQYRFLDGRGDVFPLYDYKTTTLYLGGDADAPTPAEFWASPEPYPFNIGGRGEENDDGLNLPATAFREWLLRQYRGYGSGLVN